MSDEPDDFDEESVTVLATAFLIVMVGFYVVIPGCVQLVGG